MFYGENIQDTRQLFFNSWMKYNEKQPLLPLEHQIVNVIIDHPEYQAVLDKPLENRDKRYLPEMGETNPFLHMGLHLAIREQIATNRPVGILEIYNKLLNKMDKLQVEHVFMDQLADLLWKAQRDNQHPDEKLYLTQLRQLSCEL